jgi:hypothetical protein
MQVSPDGITPSSGVTISTEHDAGAQPPHGGKQHWLAERSGASDADELVVLLTAAHGSRLLPPGPARRIRRNGRSAERRRHRS